MADTRISIPGASLRAAHARNQRAYLAAYTPETIAAMAARPATSSGAEADLIGDSLYLPRRAVVELLATLVETALTSPRSRPRSAPPPMGLSVPPRCRSAATSTWFGMGAVMTEKRTPIELDDLASEHDWQASSLRDLVAHIEEYALNELRPSGPEVRTIIALAFVAKELATKIAKQAEDLNPNSTMLGYKLMAMPAPLPGYIDGRQQVRESLAIVTDPEATREDLTGAIEAVDKLVDQDEDFTPDLESLISVVEMRGYGVGWLTILGNRRPQLTPSLGMVERRPVVEDDIRACLTAEEIEQGARAFSAGLEGYLVSVLSRPAASAQHQEAEGLTPA